MTDESTPVALGNMIGDYKRSKFMAEQLVIEAAHGGQDVVMVNPDDADRGTGHQADSDGPYRGGLPEAQVSRLRRYGVEPGGREGLCWRPLARDGEGEAG